MDVKDKFVTALLDDISNNRLVLPTLPEVALKVRKVVNDPCVTADKLSKLIGTDAALSARLLQVANSVFFKGLNPVQNVHTAVVRLGMVCVRNVVTSLVMNQLYQAKKNASIRKELQALWIHGAKVAAISNILAKRYTPLNSDEAMLGGLVHDIGILPILSRAVDFPDIIGNKEVLDEVIAEMHPNIGKLILEGWHFPQELVDVAAEHENLQYNPGEQATYTDVVIIANLHSYLGKTDRPAVDWGAVQAFEKLSLTPEKSIAMLAEAQAEIMDIQRLLIS